MMLLFVERCDGRIVCNDIVYDSEYLVWDCGMATWKERGVTGVEPIRGEEP